MRFETVPLLGESQRLRSVHLNLGPFAFTCSSYLFLPPLLN